MWVYIFIPLRLLESWNLKKDCIRSSVVNLHQVKILKNLAALVDVRKPLNLKDRM